MRTHIFAYSRTVDDGNVWNMSGGFYKNNSLYFSHSIHRSYLTWETPGLRIDTGRMRVSWGVMQFWRPTDFFNPEVPFQIESGERAGVDCAHMTVPFPERRSSLEYVYSPNSETDDSWAAKFNFTKGITDVSLTKASIYGKDTYGVSFDSYIGDGSFRGELNIEDSPNGSSGTSWAIGGGYSFPSNVTVTIEYASNADGTIIPASSRALSGISVSWLKDPLTTVSVFTSFDDEGNSLACMPRVSYSLKQNDEISLGYVYTRGKQNTLYGQTGDSAFLQFTRFF